MLVGIRGATVAKKNTRESVFERTQELIKEITSANGITPSHIVSIFVTSTPGLTAEYPATAIRTMSGWEGVPLLGAQEISKDGELKMCIRVLVLANFENETKKPVFKYLHEARNLVTVEV